MRERWAISLYWKRRGLELRFGIGLRMAGDCGSDGLWAARLCCNRRCRHRRPDCAQKPERPVRQPIGGRAVENIVQWNTYPVTMKGFQAAVPSTPS